MIQNIERTLETQQQMNNPIKKWTKDLKRPQQRRHADEKQVYEKMHHVVLGMQIKTTMRWDFPGGPVAKILHSQYRRSGFNP